MFLGLLCFNATFNNISVISWRSYKLDDEWTDGRTPVYHNTSRQKTVTLKKYIKRYNKNININQLCSVEILGLHT